MRICTKKPEYAINPTMLRAVLNGYCIDMEVPMTLDRQAKTIGKVPENMKQQAKERPQLEQFEDYQGTSSDESETSASEKEH